MTGEIFSSLHYGMLVNFSLAGVVGRGEASLLNMVMNANEMKKVAEKFKPYRFDADEICDFARKNGIKYILFTSMLKDGFRMYDTTQSDFNSVNLCGRDFCYEMMTAARKQGLKFGIYHSLYDPRDAALTENERFANICERLSELLTRYPDTEIIRCDFHRDSENPEFIEKIKAMLSRIKGDVVLNYTDSDEKLILLNCHFGYHKGDQEWRAPQEIIRNLITCCEKKRNLLLNVAFDGKGNLPEDAANIIRQTGIWLKYGGSALLEKPEPVYAFMPDDGDGEFFSSNGRLYFVMRFVSGKIWHAGKVPFDVEKILWNGKSLKFRRNDGWLEVKLPSGMRNSLMPVIEIRRSGC